MNSISYQSIWYNTFMHETNKFFLAQSHTAKRVLVFLK